MKSPTALLHRLPHRFSRVPSRQLLHALLCGLLLPVLLLCGASYGASAASAPGRSWHVSPAGRDDAAGDAASPLRTIQRAADLAQPGDTVLVAPGIYRERVAPPRGGTAERPITYRAQVPLAAIVRGSAVWRPEWRREGPSPGIWSGALDEGLFPDASQCDGANPFRVALSSTPGGRNGRPEHARGYPGSDSAMVFSLGQVFVDGELYEQVPYARELAGAPRTWHYDATSGRLAVHFPDDAPARHRVEIANQRRLFAPHRRRLGHIVVEGFVFEHCGNQYPTNFWEKEHPEWQQAGAVGTRSGHHWIIRGNVIRWTNGIALDLGNEGHPEADLERGDNGRAGQAGHHRVEDNYLLDNGAGGTASYGGTHLVLRGNVVARNNRLRFTGPKRWESGGIKLHAPAYSVIERNLVHDNFGKWGIWLDQGAGRDTRVVGNLVYHQGVGVDLEIGSAPPSLVAGNIFIETDIAYVTRESGGATFAHNLIVGSRQEGVAFTIDRKRGGNWSAERNHLFNNLWVGGAGPFAHVTPPDELRSGDRRMDFNVYTMAPEERRLALRGQSPMTLAEWQARWADYNGGKHAEAHSRAVPGSAYRFDPGTLVLELTLAFDPADVGAQPEPRFTEDFLGQPWSATHRGPGPLASLRKGVNRIELWRGLPPEPVLPSVPVE